MITAVFMDRLLLHFDLSETVGIDEIRFYHSLVIIIGNRYGYQMFVLNFAQKFAVSVLYTIF